MHLDPLPALPHIATARIRALPAAIEHAALLQACLDAAPDYFTRTDGAPADAGAARRLLGDAEADPERVVFLLLPSPGHGPAAGDASAPGALGVLDLYLHQPEPGVAHVGLLLLREAVQGRGLGRELVEALERALASSGFSALRASVGDENPAAQAFWERLGFAPAGRLGAGVTVHEKLLEPVERAALPPS
jgi:ribosomal protein S18 acetylase RimI-like enzyme